MKTAVISIFIFSIVRVAVRVLADVRIMVHQPLTSKRTSGGKLEVFGTRRLAFLKENGDVFRLHRPGLSGAPGTVSIESARLPGYFLKQRGYKFHMAEEQRDDVNSYGRLSTYVERKRSDAPDSQFFELEDRPGWFICHEEQPKLVLRAREISRTSDFVSKCGFLIKQEPDLRRTQKINNLLQKSKLNIGGNERLVSTQRTKAVNKKRLNISTRRKKTQGRSKPVSAGWNSETETKTALNTLGKQSLLRRFKGGIPVTYLTTNNGLSKALLLKTEAETTTTFRPAAVSKKQIVKEVIGTKKETGVGLPIVFSKHRISNKKENTRSQGVSNKTNLPTAEILDPSASAVDSDSILALKTDNIIHELEKGEVPSEQQERKPINFSGGIDNVLDADQLGDFPVDEDRAEGLQNAIHYEHGGHREAEVTPTSSEVHDMHLVQESHQFNLPAHQDEEERQKLMHRLVDYERDKCLSILFINKIGNRYKLVSSFNPHGYLPKGVQFSLKAIFKNYGNRKKVVFEAADPYNEDRIVLLNGEKDLLVTPTHCQDATQVVAVTSPSDSSKMMLDDNLSS